MAKSEWCPACGSPDTRPLLPWDNEVWPGDTTDYICEEPTCRHIFVAVVPEPPDDYEGDGVYADNH